jgi:DNA polymerase III alpha subunit
MKMYRAELHVHTVLSPCAGVEMIPPLIVREALQFGLNIIAITDHNATANIAAAMQAARGTGLVVLPGMELQTREEVHSNKPKNGRPGWMLSFRIRPIISNFSANNSWWMPPENSFAGKSVC